jgi:hypothetical protein
VHPAVVRRVLRAAGIEMRANGYAPSGKEIPPAVANRTVSLYLTGHPAKRIASDLRLQVKQVSALVEERTLSA